MHLSISARFHGHVKKRGFGSGYSIYGTIFRMAFVALCAAVWCTNALADAQYSYDELGRLVQMIASNGDSATYQYDPTGNLLSITRVPAGSLSIADVTPESGPVGATVMLQGVGFSVVPSSNQVKFNGVAAVVTSATTTQLQVLVPSGASNGTISVTVSGKTAQSAAAFALTAGPTNPVPTISSVTPNVGVAGDVITIAGQNFDTNVANIALRVNNQVVKIDSATTTTLTFKVPAGIGSGAVEVRTAYGAGVASSDFVSPPAGVAASQIGTTGRINADGVTYTYNSGAAGKLAILLFKGNRGQYFGLGLNLLSFSPSGGTMSLSIMSPDGSNLVAAQTVSAATAVAIPKLPTSGDYVIVLQPASGYSIAGSLTLSSDIAGQAVVNGQGVLFSSNRVGQGAIYTFSGATTQQLGVQISNITTSPAGGSARVFVFSSDGVTVIRDCGTFAAGGGFCGLSAITPGKYCVRVEPVGVYTSLAASVAVGLPDFAISDFQLTGAIFKSSGAYYAPISYKVTNIGAVAAFGTWYDRLYLSSKGTLDSTATAIANVNTRSTSLAPGASYTVNTAESLPGTTVPSGNLFIKVSDPSQLYTVVESNAANSVASIPAVSQVDLVISNLKYTGAIFKSGSNYYAPISYKVTNNSTMTATPYWYDYAYLSAKTSLDGTATSLGSVHTTSANLAPGGTYTENTTVNLGATAPSGNLFVWVSDPSGRSAEIVSNTTHSIGSLPVASQVDLVISNLKYTGAIFKSGSNYYAPISYTVTNNSTMTATPYWYDYAYLSAKASLDGTATSLGSVHTTSANLAPGGTYTVTATVNLGGTAPSGNIFVRVSDPNASSAEIVSNTANSIGSLPAASQVNLVISNLKYTGAIYKSGTNYYAPISYTVTNNSTMAATPYWYDYAYLSNKTSLDGTATSLGSVHTTSANLAPGGTYTVTTTVNLGATTPASNLFVRVSDPSARSAEIVSNAADATSFIPASLVDLQISNLTITGPITFSAGVYSIPISYSVSNKGSVATEANWTDNAYFSSSNTLDTASLLGTVKTVTTALAYGASYTVTATIQSDSGSGYLFVKTNAGSDESTTGAMIESDTSNNTAFVALNAAAPPNNGEVPLPPWSLMLLAGMMLSYLGWSRTQKP